MNTRKLITDNTDTVVRVIFNNHSLHYGGYERYLHQKHPLYPSIQSASYIFSLFGLDSSLIKTSCDELAELPRPFITLYDGLLLPICQIDEEGKFIIINERGLEEETNLKCTDPRWSHTALVLNKDDIGIKAFEINRFFWWLLNITRIILCLIVLLGLSVIISPRLRGFYECLLFFSSLLGVVISILLQISQINRANPLINKICHSKSTGSKRDCSSILDSNAAKLFGIMSWVDIGSVYFLVFVSVILICPSTANLTVLALISVVASLYIPYSLLYQGAVARKWCMLCLLIQGILFINVCISIVYLKENLAATAGLLPAAGLTLSISVAICAIYFIVISIVTSHYTLRLRVCKYRRLLFSRRGLTLLFSRTVDYNYSPISKIDVIKKRGDRNLLLVINPSCGPCVNKLRQVLHLLDRKRYTSLSIVFLIDEGDKDGISRATDIINKSLSVEICSVLKDYVDSYPASIKKVERVTPNSVLAILETHRVWCRNNNITTTPQVILNQQIVPSWLSIDELDFLIE